VEEGVGGDDDDDVELEVLITVLLRVNGVEREGVRAEVAELVAAAVLEPVNVELRVVVEDRVMLLVSDGEGDEERLRMLAMLRPR